MTRLKQIDRLLGRAVLGHTLVAWTLLLGLDFFIAFAGELSDLGKGRYGAWMAFGYVAWTLPRRAYESFTMAAIIGSVSALGGLSAHGEVTALRASGVSKLRIASSVLLTYLALSVLVVAAGEALTPWSEQQAQRVRAGAQSADLISSGRTGLWARDGAVLVHARRGALRGERIRLFDVRLYEFDAQGQLLRLSAAKQARYADHSWTLMQVTRQDFSGDSVRSEQLPEVRWQGNLDPRILAQSIVDPRFLALAELRRSRAYLKQNQLDPLAYEAAYWQRVFYPVHLLALVFATLPFAFATLRSGGLGKRIWMGMVLAVGWYFLQRGLINIATVYQLNFLWVQVLPAALLVLGAGVYFKRRA